LNKVETIVKDFNEKVEKIYNALDDETKKKLENYKDDGLKLLYAISAITNKPNPEEKTEENPQPAEEGAKSEESEKSAETQKS
jgi:hypothetical protein